MSLKYTILSLLALSIILLLALKNYETWTVPVEVVPEKGAAKKPAPRVEAPPVGGGQKEPGSIASYILVAEKNIFHPERKEFPVIASPSPLVDPSKEIKKPVVRPQVILYGVTMGEGYQSASISIQGRVPQKGERDVMTVKVGDRVGEYKLAKILPDRIGLETPEDNFEVLLYDAKSPKRRVYVRTENKPATVTSTLPGAAEPGKPAPGAPVPARPGQPITGRVAEVQAPRPVSPAPIPVLPRRQRLPVGPAPRGTQ